MADNRPNYYEALGVDEKATKEDIKRAYRRLAKRYHPDVTGGDKAKEVKFKEINQANEILGDEKKRAEYDAMRKNPFSHGFPGGGGGGFDGQSVDFDLGDLFARAKQGGGGGGGAGDVLNDLFSGMGFGGKRASRGPVPGRDVTMPVEIDLLVAVKGGESQVVAPSGRWTVKIPAGINEGQVIRVAGKGEPGARRGPAGDLLLEVHIKPHPQFRRQGADLEVDVPITIPQAVLGAKVTVPTLEGHAQVTVPAGTSSGVKLRLRGKGIHHCNADNTSCGDLYAVIQIVVPRNLSPRGRELMQEFAKLSSAP